VGGWNNIGDDRMLRRRPHWLQPAFDLDDAEKAMANSYSLLRNCWDWRAGVVGCL
jgi:hypothetical protein